MSTSSKLLTQGHCEAIAGALGDTAVGLTGSEIAHILMLSKMQDVAPALTKRKRLHNAFVESQNSLGNRTAVLAFIRHSMKPERWLREPDRYEPLRAKLNAALSFVGLAVDEDGSLGTVEAVATISGAQRRADDLRSDLARRGVHPDVLLFCRSELVADNYFHAVLEAMKSVAEKIRTRTGLTDDGADLVNRALGGSPPMLAINGLLTSTERSEQRGFANLVMGAFGMFRNPTAHAARVTWVMTKVDAEDLLSLASLIHRRLDASHMPPRV